MSEDATTTDPRHRVAAFVATARADLVDLAEVSWWSMTPTEAASTMVEVTRLRAQVTELELRVPQHAQTVEAGLDTGATSTTTWWAHTTRLTRAEAHRLTKLAGSVG